MQEACVEAILQIEQTVTIELEDMSKRLAVAKTRAAYLNATGVGHLEQKATMQAFILFSSIGQTTVYKLDTKDIDMLTLRNRNPALSCEPL